MGEFNWPMEVVGQAVLVINGDESTMRVIFGEDNAEPLLGANALQEFLLVVDVAGSGPAQ